MSTLTIDKKKYRIIPEKEYRQLLEDLRDLRLMLKRKNEKGMEAEKFFASIEKKKK
ncbi:MAG TPA: hypothetical protein VFV31_02385 [Chitinophagaceae bacterium]|nr:hypothetical protein [Chitinophagaceae bacterium]